MIKIAPQRKTKVTVTSGNLGIMYIQPHDDIFQKHRIVALNGIVDVRPGVSFKSMVANFGHEEYRI